MSPEQATGREVDARSDMFSFGAVLYEMVTGRRAFAGDSTAETLAAVVRDQPKPPSEVVPGVPKELERLIQRCLRKEPERRFQHMLDVKLELEQIKEESESGRAAAAGAGRGSTALAVAGGGARRAPGCWPTGAWLLRRSRARSAAVGSCRSPPCAATRRAPRFSPDGEQVAFAWNGEKQDNWDIYVKMIGSPDVAPPHHGSARGHHAELVSRWAADRLRSSRSPTSGDTIHLDLAPRWVGPQAERLPRAFGTPSWSPDSRWLAVAALPKAPNRAARGPTASTSCRWMAASRVRSNPARSRGTTAGPTFSPDGRHLAYLSCIGSSQYQSPSSTWVPTTCRPGRPAASRDGRVSDGALAWTRDGKSVRLRGVGRPPPVASRVTGDRAPRADRDRGLWRNSPATPPRRDRLVFVERLDDTDIYGSRPDARPSP